MQCRPSIADSACRDSSPVSVRLDDSLASPHPGNPPAPPRPPHWTPSRGSRRRSQTTSANTPGQQRTIPHPILTTPDAPCPPLPPGVSGLPLLLGRTAPADSTALVNSTVLAVAAASVDSMAPANSMAPAKSTAPSESIASLDSIEPSDPAAAARGAAG